MHSLQGHVANRSWTFTVEANQLNGVATVHKSLVQLSFDWFPQQRSVVILSVYCEQSLRNQPTILSNKQTSTLSILFTPQTSCSNVITDSGYIVLLNNAIPVLCITVLR